MQETDIRMYAQLMKELELTGLEIRNDNQVVRLERNMPAVSVAPIAPVAAAASPAAAAAQVNAAPASDTVSVFSPMVGLFYAAPAENAQPYVAIGDKVKKGQTLCIVEAMKMMNEITADCDGVIEQICVANGRMVEYGTELFRIKR